MTVPSITSLIRSRFETLVEDTQSIFVQYDNADLIESEAQPLWARCTILYGKNVQADNGGPTIRYRTNGEMIASLFAVMNKGTSAIDDLAQVVKLAFLSNSETAVKYKTPSVVLVGERGKWWQVNVVCPFYFDEFI